ncbi:endonuclease/exonuclease/phosphatase family protein [Pseudoalteromonas sp. G4]|uniref:endonuclease/exonuclease/phosphatase family protein n=1 Tax=Pseudoalteromonas sp. G4 TaxID=2992761 RepID=UPI00237D862A|nr:endonuclease/exonuclease/phosphatase family protein [Pseudoalteromonas sp. G4]MDE3270518.1 endonuclease/exonuclease/phosphatase family protein [Pseudoalteromonas sp. G4]
MAKNLLILMWCVIVLLVLVSNSSFASELYWLDLSSSITPQLIIFASVISFLLLCFNIKFGLLLTFISIGLLFTKVPLFSSSVSEVQPAISVFQLNLNYYNPNINKVYQTLATNRAELTVLFEVNDSHRAEFIRLRGNYFDYGSAEIEGFPDGIGIISKYPILSRQKHQIFQSSVRGVIIELMLAVGDTKVRVFALHPPSPRTQTLWHKRNMMLTQLKNLLESEAEVKHTIVLGDFNTNPHSTHFPKMTKYSSCYDNSGHYASWAPFSLPNSLFSLIGITIDHCLVSNTVKLNSFSTLPVNGSDHAALLYNLSLASE